MEIETKQYDKEGTLFWSSKRKKQARKNGPPQYGISFVKERERLT
jgi:hypothetical protein